MKVASDPSQQRGGPTRLLPEHQAVLATFENIYLSTKKKGHLGPTCPLHVSLYSNISLRFSLLASFFHFQRVVFHRLYVSYLSLLFFSRNNCLCISFY